MTDLKPPFWVKLHDPSRTFYDVATGLYIAQDQKKQVTILSAFIKDALHADGLIHCDPPQEEKQEEETTDSSKQESTEEETKAPESTEENSDTSDEQQDESNSTKEGEEEAEKKEEEEPEKELSLKDIQKLGKKKK